MGLHRKLGEGTDCGNCTNPQKWPLKGNEYAVSVFMKLCTKLNMDFGLGAKALELMGLRDHETLRKVNILWSIYTERKSDARD